MSGFRERSLVFILALAALAARPSQVAADEPADSSEEQVQPAPAAAAPAPAAPARPPYALPFTLRPSIAPNVVRLDTVVDGNATGVALVSTLTAAVRVLPDFAPMLRIGFDSWLPGAGGDRSELLSPLVGALYTPDAGSGLRPSLFAGVTLPFGTGEGNPAPAADAAALSAGRHARMSLDNAIFATNYTVLVGGVGLAWLYEGITLQLDLTILYGLGARTPVLSPHDDFTNFVGSFWIGYAITPWLFVGAEVRHQRFLDMPGALARAAAMSPTAPQQSYQTSLGGGVRVRIPIAGTVVLPLGVSYTRGLDGWMWAYDANVVQLDLPFVF